MALIPKGVAYVRTFKMVDSADHLSKKTGLTCTVNLSKAGGAFAAAGGAVAEIANGWYKVSLNTTDTNTAGDLAYYITATGADDTDFADQVTPLDHFSALGTTNAPIGFGTSTGQLNVASGIADANVKNWSGSAVLAPDTAGAPKLSSFDSLLLANGTGTATAGGATSITLQTAIGADSRPVGCTIKIISGTGAGQARVITVYVDGTKVVTVDRAWATNPDNTSVYAIYGTDAPALSSGLKVTGLVSADTVTTLTNLPAIPANWLTAAGINAAALNGKGDWATVNPTNLTAAQIATGVWQDTTAGDFTVAASVGKSVMNGVALGTGLTINALTTNNDKTGYSLTVAPPTAAAIATAVWTDTTAGDFATASSPGKILVTQLGGTFTTNASSIFTVAALANGPSGSGASAATIATTVWQDLTASADFSTVGSIGALLSKFAFSVANQVNANVKSVNQAGVKGTGVSGDEWGPA